MSDSAPAFLNLDKKVEASVNEMTRVFLEDLVRLTVDMENQMDDDDAEAHLLSMPTLSVAKLEEWLSRCCRAEDSPAPSYVQYVTSVIHQKLLSLVAARLELSVALETFLHGASYRLTDNDLLVNSSVVIESLGPAALESGKVMLIPLPNMFEPEPMSRETRMDVIMAAMFWEGHYLCHTALVSLEEVEDRIIDLDSHNAATKRPNVFYVQGPRAH